MSLQNLDAAFKVQSLVLKVTSRCNLNCSYCYVYNVGDDTWKTQPRVMSTNVVQRLLERVKTHCMYHHIDTFPLIFHGGEPLLCGKQFFIDFVAEAKRRLLPEVTPIFEMQTNGTLLTENWCRLLAELDIGFGISLDGPREIHDHYRVDHSGRGSYEAVLRGLKIARESSTSKTLPGILTVINVDADPLACYEHLKTLDVSTVDFLLPEATHDRPPPGLVRAEMPYADWLIRIFDLWFYERPLQMRIRIFEDIIGQILGAPGAVDSMGASRNEVLVIETDGGIEPIGSLNICGHGFTKLGANVLTHELDDALNTEIVQEYQLSGEQLCANCRSCAVHEVCGGGYLPHRYSRERRFDNPSVYCNDLMKLITHIQNHVIDQMPPKMRHRLGLAKLTYDEARAQVPTRPATKYLPILMQT